MIAGRKAPEIQEIKQRLIKLGMMEPHPAVVHHTATNGPPQTWEGVQRSLGISGFARIDKISALLGDQVAEEERIRTQARILEALNRSNRADAVVPTAGAPQAIRGVFIKSDCQGVGSKPRLETIVEEPAEYGVHARGLVEKSVQLDFTEASDITVEPLDGLAPGELSSTTIKTPQGRKFHSWLSYFYSSSGKASGSTSPTVSAPPSPKTPRDSPGCDVPANSLTVAAMLQLRPAKGILKASKASSDPSQLPPPIVKSSFLRQEEVHRLTRFTRGQRLTSQGDTDQRRSPKLRWNFQGNEYAETWSRSMYERGGVEYIAKSLTPELAMMIKRELNEVKKEMPVHEDSKRYTQFYALR